MELPRLFQDDPRAVYLIGLLARHVAAVGDSPLVIQDEEGGEYNLVETNTQTGDIALIIRPLGGYGEEDSQ